MNDADSIAGGGDALAVLQAHAQKLELRLQERETEQAERLLQAELRFAALQAGMIDLDGLKLIDGASLAVSSDGAPPEVARIMKDLRRDKPWLFSAGTSSSGASVPASSPPRKKLATEMTLEEWRTARSDLLRRR